MLEARHIPDPPALTEHLLLTSILHELTKVYRDVPCPTSTGHPAFVFYLMTLCLLRPLIAPFSSVNSLLIGLTLPWKAME